MQPYAYSSHEIAQPQSTAVALPERGAIEREALDSDGMLLPHYRTFQSLYNLFSKTYATRWDEAVRHGLENAAAMKNDTYFRALMAERLDPLGLWEWTVRADKDPLNPKDSRSEEKAKVAAMLEAECRATPDLMKFRRHLGWSAWYGRIGNQVVYVRDPECGLDWNPWVCRLWEPVDGDKLHWSWESAGHWTVFINPTHRTDYPDAETGVNDRTTFLRLRRQDYRQRFVIQTHEIEDAAYEDVMAAGRSKGVGLRDHVYWGWWLRDEMLSWMVSLAEKAGTLGLLMFKYPVGNAEAKSKAEDNAKNVNNRNALTVPVQPNTKAEDYGVEVVALPTEGLRFLKEVTFDYFDKHFERLFIGQTLSSGTEGSGLGGSGVADMHEDTKFARLKFDAKNQEECLTTDYVRTLKRLNHADAPGVYRWAYLLPDPKAQAKLEAITKAATLPGKKLEYKADEVRALVGMSKPEDGDEIVGGEDTLEQIEALLGAPDGEEANSGAATYAWDESKHKRGQPKNKGQFGPGGGLKKKDVSDAVAKADVKEKVAKAVEAGKQKEAKGKVAKAISDGKKVPDSVLKHYPELGVGRTDETEKPASSKPASKIESLARTPIYKENGVEARKSLGGGCNESQLIKLEDGTLAVFKPGSGEERGLRSGIPEGGQYKREAAAYGVAKALGMDDLVPATSIREDAAHGSGSCQEFVPDAEVAKFCPFAVTYDGEEDLARAAVFDFIVGNLDRHEGNWLVKDHTTNPKLVLIDNGLSFPVNYSDKDANWELLKRAIDTDLIVPKLDPNAWQGMEAAMLESGLKSSSIDHVKDRFDMAIQAGGKSFLDLEPTFGWMSEPDEEDEPVDKTDTLARKKFGGGS